MREATSPSTSSITPISVTVGQQTFNISSSGTTLTMQATDPAGNNNQTVLQLNLNTSTSVATFSPSTNSGYSVNLATYANQGVSLYGGSTNPVNTTYGTYAHPLGSGNATNDTSTSAMSGYFRGAYSSHSYNNPTKRPCPTCPNPLTGVRPLFKGSWLDIGISLIGIIAGAVAIAGAFAATAAVAIIAGVIAFICAVILFFELM